MGGERLTQVGRYQLRRLLGTGGMAEIHLAERTDIADFRKELAVKILHPHLRANPAILELFLHEARITSSLQHPNIVQVFSLEEADDQLFMVMEYVQGVDLRHALTALEKRGETLSTDHALAIAIEVARALRYAHAALPERAAHHPPVIHRDLSPGNVMLATSGAVKLLDFGVAKTLLGDDEADPVARGKWPYMSPEQVRGEPLDGRSDLFSLGAVLYELLTGRQAFGGRTVVDSMRRVERADVPPAPGVEPVVEEILNTLLARDRDERYADASEAVEAMAQVLMLRGRTTGERELAELVGQLTSGAPATPAAPKPRSAAAPLRQPTEPGNPFDVGDLTGQLTIPTHRPGELSASANIRSEPLNSANVETVTDPFGEGQTTLPPTTVERPRPDHGPPPAPPAANAANAADDDDEQETTAARPLSGELPVLPSLVPEDEDEITTLPGGSDLQEDPPVIQQSEPRVFFDHFMPADELQETPTPPRIWTPKNLVILGLAILAILIAGLAILIAVKQQMQRRQATPVAVAPSRSPRPAPDADAQAPRSTRRLAPPPSDASVTAPRDAGPLRAAPTADAAAPRITPPAGRPPVGLPKRGQLDIITRPPGARVVVNGKPQGQSPLRIAAKPGGKLRVVVSLQGRKLYKSPIWMPQVTGRRLVLMLPRLAKPFRVAPAGRTSIRVTCRTHGQNRVYIDGHDTGYDCPTPPLAVLPTVHTVSMYVPASHRVVWKRLRPPVRKVSEVKWPH